MDHVYAWCALLYHWDQETVDRQDFKYIQTVMSINSDWISDIVESISSAFRH